MAFDKDFVIKNGLEVNENLIYADSENDRVGIGTTIATTRLEVKGGINAEGMISAGATVVGTSGSFSNIVYGDEGLELGVGATFVSAKTDPGRVGINSSVPRHTLDLYGPVSIGETAAFIFGDVTVTGDIKGNSFDGQISAGGTISFTEVTVTDTTTANNANIYTLFRVNDANNTDYTFLADGTPGVVGGVPAGIGFTENTNSPDIFLMRGQNYRFDLDCGGNPFYIKLNPTTGLTDIYNTGVDNNGSQVGILTFRVPFNAPDQLFYQSSNTGGMGGKINIVGVFTGGIEELLVSGIATITNGEFEQLYVSGITTLAGNGASITNLGVTGVSTLAHVNTDSIESTGIVTAPTFAGIATGASRLQITGDNSNTSYQVPFAAEDSGQNSQLFVDTTSTQFTFNPSSRVLKVDTFEGTLAGTAEKAMDIQVDERNNNAEYQVGFITANGNTFQRVFIDTNNAQFTYNPSTSTLTSTNFVGSLNGTALNATNINIANTDDSGDHFLVFTDSSTNGANKRPEVDDDLKYDPSTNVLTAGGFSGGGGSLTDLNATQLTQGKVPSDRGRIASSTNGGFLQFTGSTKDDGCLYGGTSNPSNTTRLNYDGQLHATGFTGPLTGNASSASKVFVSENDTETDGKLLFVSDTDSNQSVLGDSGLTYNSNTNLLTVVIGSVNASGDNNNFGNTSLDATTVESLDVTNTTASTSRTTGAVTIAGGLGVVGAIFAGGDITAFNTSDRRLKDNIKPIENSLSKVESLSGNTFTWKEEALHSGEDVGVIAQEVQEVLPTSVTERDDGTLAVNYEKLVPLLIEAVKELSSEVKELKSKLGE